MALESAISINRAASAERGSLAQRGADYFAMSSPAEFVAAASCFAIMIALKLVNVTRYRFDTDESQHMHVIWAWARGFVQYRDVFDNHMPLFQIMFAPVFGVIGDRATVLYWMRFILLPMYFAAAWCTYRIGELLFSRRAGVWAVILAGLFAKYHFTSLEFRPDNLWAPLWLLCVVTLISGALTVPRALKAGLLLGLCFSISMKSILLLVALVAGAAIALALIGRKKLGQSWSHLARCTGAFFFATLLPSVTIAAAFAFAGLWRDFYYCNFEHNILLHADESNHPMWWIFPAAVFPMVFLARLIVRAAPTSQAAFRRALIFLLCGLYLAILHSFWTLRSRQDYLPYYPLAFVLVSGGLVALSSYMAKSDLRVRPCMRQIPLPAFVVLVEFFLLIITHPFWVNGAELETNLLRGVLKLTEPGDYVLDCKGETIFRQRCFWPVTESIMLARLDRGLVPDDAARRAVETRTCVAVMKGRMPPDAKRFIGLNYIPVGDDLRVAGSFLKKSAKDNARMEFDIVIPASYKIIARDGAVKGILDGTPYDGARFLGPGRHTFVQTSMPTPLVVLWAQAVDRNFVPETFSVPRPKG